MPNFITSFCKINQGKVTLNNQIDEFNNETNSTSELLTTLYKQYQLNYPKFYKMDSLCKLALITSEILLKQNPITHKYKSEDISIVISNSSSSLDVDTAHQRTINDKTNYFPSPANFVYTLPNILIGEIAIKNKIMGENIFFISENFNSSLISNYSNSLLNSAKAECCVAGWVEVFEENYSAFLFTVEKEKGKLDFENNFNQLEKLWHQ